MPIAANLQRCAAAVALAASGSAFAAAVTVAGFSYGPAGSGLLAVPGYSGAAGQFSGTLDGGAFITFRTDLAQGFAFNTPYSDYTLVDGVTAWGASRALALDQLMSTLLSRGWPDNATKSAALQAAVWEILYETSGSYGLDSGSFRASSSRPAVQAALNSFEHWAWDWQPGAPVTVHVSQLYSRDRQDFLVLSTVPEPGTCALALAGLGAIGLVARRRAAVRR